MSGELLWFRQRWVSYGLGASMVRRRVAAWLVLVCGMGFAPIPSAASAADPMIRQATRPCVGDCDNSSAVSVDEIIKGVGIALGSLPLNQCPRFDCDGSGRVAVDCIIKAVDAALSGCSSEPTASPARTGSPTATSSVMPTPTPTVTRTTTSANTPTVTATQPGDSVTVFDTRPAFTSAAGALLTDDYEDSGYAEFQNDASMNAVNGLTRYKTTFFADFDEVIATPNGHIYAGGFTGGSFQLDFTAPSLGGSGVHAVGFDFANNIPMPYVAFVSFADGTSRNFILHASPFQFLSPPPDFIGLTSAVEITRIHIGLTDGGATSANLFAIDNLSVAAPENGDAFTDAHPDGRRGSA